MLELLRYLLQQFLYAGLLLDAALDQAGLAAILHPLVREELFYIAPLLWVLLQRAHQQLLELYAHWGLARNLKGLLLYELFEFVYALGRGEGKLAVDELE